MSVTEWGSPASWSGWNRGVVGVDAGVDGVVVGVDAGVGAGVGVSGTIVGTGVGAGGAVVGSDVVSGTRVLAGNAVAAALGLCVAVEMDPGVSVVSGTEVTWMGTGVTASPGVGTVATAPPGAGVCSSQASRAARITKAVHRGNFNIREIISIAISEFRVPYG